MADYILSAELSLKDRFTSKIKSAFKNSELFKRKIEETDEKMKKFEKNFEFDKVKDGFKGATKSADKFNNTLKKFDNNTSLDRLGKKVGKLTNKIDSSVSKLAKKTGKILKWGVVGGTGLGIGALKIGAEFETLKARMVTAFEGNKELAKEHFIWGNKFANETPFSNDEVLDAMVKLRAYGYKDPRRLMTLLGDFAAGNQRSLDDAVEAYADAANNQFFRMTGFGLKRETVLDYAKNILKDPIPMNGEEIANFDKFMKVLEIMMKERTKDGMKNAAKTLNGMVSTTSGLIKSSIAKLVGLTDEGEVRAGSLMDKVKEKFENLNTYLESEEGKAAFDKWVKAFDDAIPKVIEIGKSIKNKLIEIFGEDYLENFNKSINEFDPSSFNKKLQSVKDNFDELTEKMMRIAGVYAGMQLLKVNPYLGVVAMTAGAFTPEIVEAIKKLDESKKENEEKINKAVEKLIEQKKKTGYLPERPTSTYAPAMQIKESKELKENQKFWNFLTQDGRNGKYNFSNEEIFLKYTPEFKAPELKFKEKVSEIYSEKETIKEKIKNIKTEEQTYNEYAQKNLVINHNDNRIFNTTNNNYTENKEMKNHSESNNNYISSDSRKIYNSENNTDNSKVYNSETKNNSFSSQKNIDNSKSSVSNNELSNVYNTEKNNDNSKNITNNKEISNAYNSSSTNNTNDNSKVYNNNTEKKEVKEKVRTLKQNITNHNNITIKIDGAITNKDDKIAYQDIANQLKSELQKTIDKTFENMTNEIEFA